MGTYPERWEDTFSLRLEKLKHDQLGPDPRIRNNIKEKHMSQRKHEQVQKKKKELNVED